MFDLTKLETLDLDNLKELTRKFGEEFSFCKEGVLVLIPGSQQYGYFADSMKGNFWTDTAMKGYVDANVGMSSFLIPNLVIDKPFYVDVTGAMMFMWAAKEKSPISKIEQRNDKDFLVSMASGATFSVLNTTAFNQQNKTFQKNG